MPAADIYDTIGHGYARQRRPDPQIAAQLTAALGDAQRCSTSAPALAPTSRPTGPWWRSSRRA